MAGWVGHPGVGSGHHGFPQQIREENGTLEIPSVVSFYRYFTGGGFFSNISIRNFPKLLDVVGFTLPETNVAHENRPP